MFAQTVKSLLKSTLPVQTHHQLRDLVQNRSKRSVVKRIVASFDSPAPPAATLGENEFDALLRQYPYLPQYRWDIEALIERGRARGAQLLKLPGAASVRRTLELGCWDGMVSGCLAERGIDATAIDYRDVGFEERAKAMGAKLLQMDASKLEFADDGFDLVFSYDAFEHVRSPEAVLKEALRVVRPGGLVYFDFGPLYFSPFGEHAYESIPIPYCQFLFSEQQLNDFADRLGKPRIDFDHVNRWSLEQYRKLWADLAPVADVVFNCESKDLRYLDLIEKYRGNFQRRSSYPEDFFVDGVKILFRKRAAARRG